MRYICSTHANIQQHHIFVLFISSHATPIFAVCSIGKIYHAISSSQFYFTWNACGMVMHRQIDLVSREFNFLKCVNIRFAGKIVTKSSKTIYCCAYNTFYLIQFLGCLWKLQIKSNLDAVAPERMFATGVGCLTVCIACN